MLQSEQKSVVLTHYYLIGLRVHWRAHGFCCTRIGRWYPQLFTPRCSESMCQPHVPACSCYERRGGRASAAAHGQIRHGRATAAQRARLWPPGARSRGTPLHCPVKLHTTHPRSRSFAESSLETFRRRSRLPGRCSGPPPPTWARRARRWTCLCRPCPSASTPRYCPRQTRRQAGARCWGSHEPGRGVGVYRSMGPSAATWPSPTATPTTCP